MKFPPILIDLILLSSMLTVFLLEYELELVSQEIDKTTL